MNDTSVHKTILSVYRRCHIQSFPLDCTAIIEHHGIRIFTYQEFSGRHPELYQIGMRYSRDAFQYRNLFCYNTDMPPGRVRFSLMHELGHYLLGHGSHRNPRLEQEANYFASHILAPRLLIYYSGCQSLEEIADHFLLTTECAAIAYEDYLLWRKDFLASGLRPSEQPLYRHFYLNRARQIVWHISHCHLCGTELYNNTAEHCVSCHNTLRRSSVPEQTASLLRAEEDWLCPG